MDKNEPTARQVTEELLHQTGQALLEHDFDRLIPHFTLPQHLETFDGRKLVSTVEEFRQLFDELCARQAKAGMNRLDRRCIEAAFKTNVQIEAMYETTTYRDTMILAEPYRTFCVIRQVDERWQFSSNMYGLNYTFDEAAQAHRNQTRSAP